MEQVSTDKVFNKQLAPMEVNIQPSINNEITEQV